MKSIYHQLKPGDIILFRIADSDPLYISKIERNIKFIYSNQYLEFSWTRKICAGNLDYSTINTLFESGLKHLDLFVKIDETEFFGTQETKDYKDITYNQIKHHYPEYFI